MESIRLPRSALRWFTLAVGALAVAGVLAVVLVLARVPTVGAALAIDPELARGILVVHVNLATGVWFFAVIAGLSCLGSDARSPRWAGLTVSVATAGVIAFAVSAVSGARAVLSDYVPVLDHRLFLAGLVAFAAGIVLEVLRCTRSAATRDALPADARQGVRAAGIAFSIAMLTIVAALGCRDPGASQLDRFEQLFWGAGHVLQFAATAGMLAAWLVLAHQLTGTTAISSRLAALLFTGLVLPTSIAPWLVATRASPHAFTRMMELGIAPAVLLVMLAIAMVLRKHRRASRVHWPAQPIALIGLSVGAAMTLLGFALGAAITGDTTLTPAHYHISIGAVTVSFMATLMVLLQRSGASIRRPRLAMWQPLIYGAGQTVFACGLAIAGFWGHAARKHYGDHVMSVPSERIGWIIAGAGGLLAFAGGIAFVAVVVGCRSPHTSIARR